MIKAFSSLLLLLVAVTVLFEPSEAGLLGKYHVKIFSDLGNDYWLNVHCQSADDDLGEKWLLQGNETSWDFGLNLVGTTLYYCDMYWGYARYGHFVVFDEDRDRLRCHNTCFWWARQDGLYGNHNFNDPDKADMILAWDR